MRYDITSIYYCIDEFCKTYEQWTHGRLISGSSRRRRAGRMSLSELLTIAVCYHFSGFKCFKYYYLYEIQQRQRHCFPHLISYSRFIQLLPSLFLPLHLLFHCVRGEETGLYFIDSTALPVCHNLRISRHKVFEGLAARGKTTMGWFFGFKLHLVLNHKGQIMALKITKGDTDDRSPVPELMAGLTGMCGADKGYISEKLFQKLYRQGLKIIVGIRKNMKNILMPLQEKYFHRKRYLIETTFDLLKSGCNLFHTRHRSPANAFVHLLAAIVAYAFKTGAHSRLIKGNLIQN